MINRKKIIRAVTVSQSLGFCRNVMIGMRTKGYEMMAVSSPGQELDNLKKQDGFYCVAVPMQRHISLLKDIKSLVQLIKIFELEKPFVVHSMTPKAGMLCMLAAWIVRVPCRIHTFTGLVWPTSTGFSRKLLMFTDWVTCACATHIIPEGQGVKNDLQKYITKKPMKVLGYGNVRGVDMEFWTKKENVQRDVSKFNFIFVGRVVRDKGIKELIQAFSKLNEKYSHAHLFLVGAYEDDLDPIDPETRGHIASNPAIEAVGRKNKYELIDYYSISDCFVFPSYREGFPNTVLEAGAMGLPSIVTDINGSNEIIEQGKNGLIVASKDAEALYSAMEKMLTDNECRQKMASNARPMIASRFEQGYVQKCLYDFYEEILIKDNN